MLTGAYTVAEVAGGLLANSLALLADAGHMLSDVAALGSSLFAVWIAGRPPTPRRTYGFYRAEILAALANGAALITVSGFIFVEALHRLRQPSLVHGSAMMAIAAGGLAINLFGLWVLGGDRHRSLNLRGARLHVLSDALGSLGAILAGALIWSLGWHWTDPLVSILIGLLIVRASWRLLGESASVLMEGTPPRIDLEDVRAAMASTPGVLSIHDLHIWTITSGMESLSAHVVAEDRHRQDALLTELCRLLEARFGIRHVTLQIEAAHSELDCKGHCG